MSLRTDFRDPEFSGEIQYQLINNGNGTVSFVDKTVYLSEGDYIVAANINETNTAVNALASLYSAWISSYTPLPTNFVDAQFNGKKQFQMSQSGNTVTLTDVTTYSQNGSTYHASDINNTNTLINNLSDGCSLGLAQIKNALSIQGATNTDDLAKALDDMVTSQTTRGYNDGINYAKNNPASVSPKMYTEAQYQTLRSNMTSEKSVIDGYRTQLNRMDTECAALAQDAHNHVNAVKGGDAADFGMAMLNYANTCMNDIVGGEGQSVNTYSNNSATAAVYLGGLLQ